MDNLQILLQDIKDIKARLEKIENRDHVNWNNPLVLGSTLDVTGSITGPSAKISGDTQTASVTASGMVTANRVDAVTHGTALFNSQADDTVLSLDLYDANAIGMCFIGVRGSTYNTFSGITVFRGLATQFHQILVGQSNLLVATVVGVPVYSSYTDAKFTAVISTNGSMYFVNRMGLAVSYWALIMGY